MPKNQASKPLEIKISTVVAVAALLGDTDPAALSAELEKATGGIPDYFEDEFTVLDFGPADPAPAPGSIDWPGLIALFRAHRLNPVAVRNAPPQLEPEIRAHGLTIDTMVAPRLPETPAPKPAPAAAPSRKPAAPATPAAPAASPAAAPAAPASASSAPAAPAKPAAPGPAAAAPASAMIVDTPVRSGQRIYARGCDLVLMAVVNHGAEVIADGSIHVYAPLRGRALAGASGNADARIISTSMEAELVSIAGVYRTFEGGWPKELSQRPAQVRLVDDKLALSGISTK